MVVGVLQFRLNIYESTSLKDKRRVVKSLKDRLRRRFNVSIAEIGMLESRQAAELAVAVVSNDSGFAARQLQEVVNFVERHRAATLVDYDIDIQ